MIRCLFLLLCTVVIDANHFNGGTIRCVPANPYNNSSSTAINVIQTYWWSYPIMSCANDVPISTTGRSASNTNLTCIADCSTDGGYSTEPVNILTDCISASSSLGMMTSQRSVNTTLSSNAHFYLAYVGSAWRALNYPVQNLPPWSIVSFVDLQMRPDGFINTPPVARILSPQYAIVNKTVYIPILVSDVNTGDDIRCRWSVQSNNPLIDECGGACYPTSMPNGVTLSNCTLTFRGPIASVWYAAAIQVEDFINTTSTTPMSSVPVQFLISVTPEPACSEAPVIIPLTGCLEVTVGVLQSFDIFVLNLCDPNVTSIVDIVVTGSINNIQMGNVTNLPTNTSLSYKTLTWTSQANQIGPQQLCMMAYTNEFVQSSEYCVTFVVITSSQPCTTTTTTSTSTFTTAIVITESVTSNKTPVGNGPNWRLIAGISSLALPLALCCCYCLYQLLWSPAAKRRGQEEEEEEEKEEHTWRYSYRNSSTESMLRTTTPHTNENSPIEVPKKSYQVYNILPKQNSTNSICSPIDSEGSILFAIYNNTNGRRANSVLTHNTEESIEMGNAWMQPRTSGANNSNIPTSRHVTLANSSASAVSNCKTTNESFNINHSFNDRMNVRAFSTPPFSTDRFDSPQPRLERTSDIGQSRLLDSSSSNFKEWARIYLFGSEHKTGIPRIRKPP